MSISAKDVKELRERTDAPMMECKSALESAGGDMEAAVKILRERGIAKMAKRADRETVEGVVRVRVGPGNRVGTAVVVTCETDFSARNEAFQKLADATASAAMGLEGDTLTPAQVLEATAPDGRKVKEVLETVANSIRENMSIKEVVRYGGICGSYVHFDGRTAALLEVEAKDGSRVESPEFGALLKEVCQHIVASDPPPLAIEASAISPEIIEQEKEIFIKQAMDTGKPKEIAEKMVSGRMKKFYSERALVEQPFIKNPDQSVAAFLAASANSLGVGQVHVKRFIKLHVGG